MPLNDCCIDTFPIRSPVSVNMIVPVIPKIETIIMSPGEHVPIGTTQRTTVCTYFKQGSMAQETIDLNDKIPFSRNSIYGHYNKNNPI